MPITPHFDISQTEDHVQVDIHVPHVRVSPESLHVVLTDEQKCLHFASPPYLLILTFQHAFRENAEDACAKYDPLREHGRVVLTLAKDIPGVHWDDLDMVGALMKPRSNLNQFIDEAASSDNNQKSTWIKEVLQETSEGEIDQDAAAMDATGDSNDGNDTNPANGYGFARMFQGIFSDLARDGLAREMLEIPMGSLNKSSTSDNPLYVLQEISETSTTTPRQRRHEMEQSKFVEERYAQDLFCQDDYLYQSAMAMRPHWSDANSSKFTPEESAQLASIPYPLLPESSFGQEQQAILWMGVLDLLFAYCYDHLLTDGDPTVESAWTVSKLSCSLSWLESFADAEWSVEDVVCQSIRRSLVYPYLRNLEFAVHCWKQVSNSILTSGRRCIVRCLLQVRSVLDQSELYYLGNKLYIDPYLAWLQKCSINEGDLLVLAEQINRSLVDSKRLKERIDLGLSKIERVAFAEIQGEEVSSTGSDSESSDEESSSDDESDESSSEEEEEDATPAEQVDAAINPVAASSTCELAEANSQQQKGVPRSNELLDGNFGQGNGAGPALIMDMSRLSLEPKEASSNQRNKPATQLIQEIE